MELTWKVGEKRVGDIWGSRAVRGSVPIRTNVVFEVMSSVNSRDIADWSVVDSAGGGWVVCEEWGGRLLSKDVPIAVNQRRMMTIPGFHYTPVEVLIRMHDHNGTAASCVNCGDTDHYDKYWGVFSSDDYGAISSTSGDKSVPFALGQQRLMTVPGVHEDRPVLVKILEIMHYGVDVQCLEEACAYHHSSRWGTGLTTNDYGAVDPARYDDGIPRVGQLRRTKVRHIHGDKDVTVRVTKVYPGLKSPELWGFGVCLDCDAPYHHGDMGNEWVLDQPSYLVTDFQQEQKQQEPQKQPEPKETDMEIEKRKQWAATQNWERFVPTDLLPEKSGQKPMPGEVWRVGYNSDYKAVVLVLGSEALVLCGRLSGYKAGEVRDFTGGSLPNKSALLCTAESYDQPMLWKKGELRRGPLRAALAADSAVLMENATYRVVSRHGGSYDWDVELLSGPQRGVLFGASEQWLSTPIPEVLQPLFLTTYEVDPNGTADAPSKFSKGDVYQARNRYGDVVAAGDMLVVSRDSSDFYFFGGRMNDSQERVYGKSIYAQGNMHLQLMRPVGSKGKVIPVSEQCGDKSTAYGLTCSMQKNHGGEQHGRGDARWDVAPKVIKLGLCANGHRDASGAAVMAALRVVTDTDGETQDLCAPCNVDREKKIATRQQRYDKDHPQPKHQPRYQVDSMTLDAGGVFRVGG